MKIYKKAILPKGFKANGIAAGIKKSGKLDLALFASDIPAKAAGKFTSSKILAAPVQLDKKLLKDNKNFSAIIVNSGNANCFTAKLGIKDAQAMAALTARNLGLKKECVLVSSTGIIGRRLPLNKIKKAIPVLVNGLSKDGIDQAKKAIMTTDTFSKEITVKFNLGRKNITLCGIAKGAGMIAPNLATMLCFVFTDANITQRALNKALAIAVDNSFNCITVDGCMSTNDSVMLMANAQAGNKLIDIDKNFNLFLKALNISCLELAKMIVKDAEGATKFIRIKVAGAKNSQEAKKGAKAVANSNLFKTAIYGQNPNFGRIVAALGASGIALKEDDIKIKVSSLRKKEIEVNVALGQGQARSVVYTSDLTPEYIKINAGYN